MDNLTLDQEQNWTACFRSKPYYTIYFVTTNTLVFISFPITTLVFVKLLDRLCKTKSFLPAEVFLLQINFTNVFLFISNLLDFLDALNIVPFSMPVFLVFYIPSFTARPVFLLTICVIFYLAVVHPVTYMTAKAFCHWECLVTTIGWLYALVMDVAIVICETDTTPLASMFFHLTNLPILFFCVAMLRSLSSAGPGTSRQTLNSAKRKAFKLVLSNLVSVLVYYLPQAYFLTYVSVAPTDMHRFQCSEGLIIMMLMRFSDFTMPIASLYSLTKLGV